MRAAAILFVVGAHSFWVFPEASGSWVTLITFSGVLGVELFFVLSGFLIGRILYRIVTDSQFHRKQLFYFLIRRWFRTLPNYYLVLLLNILLVLIIGRNLPESLPKYFFFLQNITSGMDIFFTESWSLPVEEVAYIIGPLLLWLAVLFGTKQKRKRQFLLVTVFLLLLFLCTKIVFTSTHTLTTLEQWNIELRAVVLYRIDSIFYGVLFAYLSKVASKQWYQWRFHGVFIGLLLFFGLHAYVASHTITEAPWLYNVLYFPLCSLAIALWLPWLSSLRKAPVWLSRPITFISIISYSMYLLHYSILLQLLNTYVPIAALPDGWLPVFSLAYIALTMGCAYLLYRYYEKPMMDLREAPAITKKFQPPN